MQQLLQPAPISYDPGILPHCGAQLLRSLRIGFRIRSSNFLMARQLCLRAQFLSHGFGGSGTKDESFQQGIAG